ncbi:MAG: hypothetical protein FD143_3117, partial [Ignavibacteria bacterium]
TALDSTSNSSQESKESSGNQGSTPKRELTLKELWAILNDAQIESKAVSKIPLGGKSNCHFVLKLKNAGQRPFYDDAGAWNGHKSKTTKTRCVLKHGIISCPAKIDESQTKVIVTRRYYVHKQGDYRKRISSFDTVPDLYVVEYIGTAPEPLLHDNRKRTAHPYIRTDPDVIEEIRNADKMATHRHVYAELLEKNPLNGPRNSEQVRKVRSKNKIQRQLTTASNLPEEVLSVLKMQSSHPFVRRVLFLQNQQPIIILYTDEQIDQIKQFCSERSPIDVRTPLGIDRTFNLSSCFATVTAFKQMDVIRSTGEHSHPIIMGPIMLHWEAKEWAYMEMFYALKVALRDTTNNCFATLPRMTFGSDQERAIRSALHVCFPDARILTCTLHLKENLRLFLDNKGFAMKDREAINRIVFDSFGTSATTHQIDQISHSLNAYCIGLHNGEIAIRYFSDHVRPLLFEQVQCSAGVSDTNPGDWTNNNCESMNHIIKLITNWKTSKLPKLVDSLYEYVRQQTTDLERALYNEGDFMLSARNAKLAQKKSAYIALSDEDRARYFHDFLQGILPKQGRVTSRDGNLSLPNAAKLARKPGQRCRIAGARTRCRHK